MIGRHTKEQFRRVPALIWRPSSNWRKNRKLETKRTRRIDRK